MEIKIHTPAPVTPPPDRVTVEMSIEEALVLRAILGNVRGDVLMRNVDDLTVIYNPRVFKLDGHVREKLMHEVIKKFWSGPLEALR